MKILVANLGSTSFKFRLFDLSNETQLARGGMDRIGQEQSRCSIDTGKQRAEFTQSIPDHKTAMQICLAGLTDPQTGCLQSVEEVKAVGFKAVFAGHLSGVRRVNDELLAVMDDLAEVAPAHNPPYTRAMRELKAAFPQLPLVVALETGFHDTIPLANRVYAVPDAWRTSYGIQRWGFHGASHRFVSGRCAELMGRSDLRVVTCHLGGSSSLCASRDGKSQATTMGMSPQTGLPQNNRVGDFDTFAMPYLMRKTGKSLTELLQEMSSQGGLLGLSGLSGDLRDLEEAAAKGHAGAQLALDMFISNIRQYLGAYFAVLGGVDAVVFTGGIGENSDFIRAGVCRNLEWAGLHLDDALNQTGPAERTVSTAQSPVKIWLIPTNEELVVARQTAALLASEV